MFSRILFYVTQTWKDVVGMYGGDPRRQAGERNGMRPAVKTPIVIPLHGSSNP